LLLYVYVLSVQRAVRVYALAVEAILVTPQPLNLSGFFVFERLFTWPERLREFE
jgi:hypothetical protein